MEMPIMVSQFFESDVNSKSALLRKSGKKLNRYVYRWDQQGLVFFSIFFFEKRIFLLAY